MQVAFSSRCRPARGRCDPTVFVSCCHRPVACDELRELARRQGMKTLREDGWRLVAEGATTADEVMRVTKDEELDSGVENTTA